MRKELPPVLVLVLVDFGENLTLVERSDLERPPLPADLADRHVTAACDDRVRDLAEERIGLGSPVVGLGKVVLDSHHLERLADAAMMNDRRTIETGLIGRDLIRAHVLHTTELGERLTSAEKLDLDPSAASQASADEPWLEAALAASALRGVVGGIIVETTDDLRRLELAAAVGVWAIAFRLVLLAPKRPDQLHPHGHNVVPDNDALPDREPDPGNDALHDSMTDFHAHFTPP